MVQIEPPGGQVAVGRASVDSEAITEEAISASSAEQLESGTNDAGGFAGEESVQQTAVASAIPPEWQSERTRRSRQIALVVALSLSGLLTAIALFGWFVRSWSGTTTAQADSTTVANTDEMPTDPTPDPVAQQPSTEVDSQASTEPAADEPAADETTEAAGEESSGDHGEPDGAGSERNSGAAAPGDEPMLAGDSIPSDLIPRSPIDDPPQDPLDSRSVEAKDEPIGMQDLGGLEQFIPFLEDSGALEAPPLKPPPAMADVQIEAAAEVADDPLGPAKARKLNLKADLSKELALNVADYSLADLVLLIGQLTGVPIQIDWVSFDLAGIDISAPVPMQKGWHSAQAHLEKTAAALGAEIRQEEALVILTLTDDRFNQTLTPLTDVRPFGPAQNSAIATLNQFLNGNAGGKQVQVGNTRQQQQLAALSFEALRRMRGIAANVDDRRLHRWARAAESGIAEWPLITGGDPGAQSDAPITIAEFLSRISSENGAKCVVNWYDANRRAAAPQRLIFPHVQNDAAGTIQQALTPFKLQVRIVDDRHWWVGTESTYDRLTAVVWTAPLGAARENFTKQLDGIMAGAPRDIYRLAVDEESDRAILLLPRYIVRQLPKIAPSIAAVK